MHSLIIYLILMSTSLGGFFSGVLQEQYHCAETRRIWVHSGTKLAELPHFRARILLYCTVIYRCYEAHVCPGPYTLPVRLVFCSLRHKIRNMDITVAALLLRTRKNGKDVSYVNRLKRTRASVTQFRCQLVSLLKFVRVLSALSRKLSLDNTTLCRFSHPHRR